MAGIFDELTGKSTQSRVSPVKADDSSPSALSGPQDSAALEELTARQTKDVVLELLKCGLLEAQRKPNLFRDALARREAVARILEPLDLAMRVDEFRGLAYVVIAQPPTEGEQDDWSHPLVRRQRLNLEQSLLIAILRQQFIAHEQQAGVGSTDALIAVEDLLPHLQMYLGDLGSDAQEQKRLRTLLEQLRGHGIVSEIDAQDRVGIRPIIAHLANPQSLQSLLSAFRDEAHRAQADSYSREEGEG
jgi:hypothetical protein